MNTTEKRNSLIPKGDSCFGCPYYTFDDRGFKAECLKYNTLIFSDGFRGIKTNNCKNNNEAKK